LRSATVYRPLRRRPKYCFVTEDLARSWSPGENHVEKGPRRPFLWRKVAELCQKERESPSTPLASRPSSRGNGRSRLDRRGKIRMYPFASLLCRCRNAGVNLPANLPEGCSGESREQAAASVNVSPRLVESASKVQKNGTPKLIEMVDAGEVAESVAGLSPITNRRRPPSLMPAPATRSHSMWLTGSESEIRRTWLGVQRRGDRVESAFRPCLAS
jgi:hypothetical protein